MPRLPPLPGAALLFLLTLPACSTPPRQPAPRPLLQRCPAVTACPLPALAPTTNQQPATGRQLAAAPGGA
ncbi:Rz1-like lysis system protein LysC [Chromobacterium sphagni]|uniref:Rz1-like lysis system protein LysC n=1 Tax=Chromobacterium sphagni TaxID=1903179 RepID=UPI0008D9EC5C|nr:Rz1-like lysis system protein LysC [Chromobacterium sphagni]